MSAGGVGQGFREIEISGGTFEFASVAAQDDVADWAWDSRCS